MSFILYLLTFFLSIFCVLLAHLKYKFSYWSRRGVSHVKPALPFGNATEVIRQRKHVAQNARDMYEELKSRRLRYGGTYMLTKPELYILDPELVKDILVKDFQHFTDRRLPPINDHDPLSANLLTLRGTQWKQMRQKLTPTFTSAKIKIMFHTMKTCSEQLEQVIEQHAEESRVLDVKNVASRFTTDVIASCAFGIECNSLKDPSEEFYARGKEVVTPSFFRILATQLIDTFPFLYTVFQLSKFDPKLKAYFRDLVFSIMDFRDRSNIKRNDFLQFLLNIKNTGNVDADVNAKDVSYLNRNEVAAQSLQFFIAGFETSSAAITFTLYELAVHLEIQEKVRKEIREMFGKYEGELTYDGLMELHYLEQVINESLRMHPPVPLIGRMCSKDYKIPNSDTVIEKGTFIVVPALGFHYDAEYFPEPEQFKPERFEQDECEKRPALTFLPFGTGPRSCIGLRFGFLQTKVGLVTLLKNHRFTVNPRTKTPLKISPKSNMLSAEGGIWLDVKRI